MEMEPSMSSLVPRSALLKAALRKQRDWALANIGSLWNGIWGIWVTCGHEGVRVGSILFSIKKCPCLRTTAGLCKHVVSYWYNLLILYKELLICFLLVCLAPLGAPSGGSQIPKLWHLKTMWNAIWSRVVRLSLLDLCYRLVCDEKVVLDVPDLARHSFLRTTFSLKQIPYVNLKSYEYWWVYISFSVDFTLCSYVDHICLRRGRPGGFALLQHMTKLRKSYELHMKLIRNRWFLYSYRRPS